MRTQSLDCTWQTWSRVSPRPAARLRQEEVLPVCGVMTWEAPLVPGPMRCSSTWRGLSRSPTAGAAQSVIFN